MIKITKKDFNVPNVLTALRIVLIIPFLIFFFAKNLVGVLCMMALSGISDMLDGYFARKLDQVTDIGKLLDPVADKLTQITISFCLAYQIHLLIPMFVLFLLKDGLMLIGGAVMIKRKIKPVSAQWYGKLSTTVFYVSVLTIVLKEAFLPKSAVLLYSSAALVIITCILMVFTFVKYTEIYVKKLRCQKAGLMEEPAENLNVQ